MLNSFGSQYLIVDMFLAEKSPDVEKVDAVEEPNRSETPDISAVRRVMLFLPAYTVRSFQDNIHFSIIY